MTTFVVATDLPADRRQFRALHKLGLSEAEIRKSESSHLSAPIAERDSLAHHLWSPGLDAKGVRLVGDAEGVKGGFSG